ncbi:50S ribosomal protein L21e [archaeon]|nr:50S ribosomal protein L21e [archaeon]
MVSRTGSARRKTRSKYKKNIRQKGKLSLTKYLQSFKPDEKVCLKAEPAYQKGMYFRRFHGQIGIIKRKKGACYEVLIKDGNKPKTLIVHPIHLQRWK